MIEIREARIEDVTTVYKLGENVDGFHTIDQIEYYIELLK